MKRCPTCGKHHSRVGPRRPQSYCCACHAAYMRENRPRYSELGPEAKSKSNARAYANRYERLGKLKREPCADCGAQQSQKHHEDYSKPLAVQWLCRKCHLLLHKLGDVPRRSTGLAAQSERLAA